MEVEITLKDVGKALKAGARVLFLMRHAQRPRISSEDADFGMNIPITPHGFIQAFNVGRALRGSATSVQFMASPFLRTRMTCAAVREGMDIRGGAEELAPGRTGWDWVEADDHLGNGAFYFNNHEIVHRRLEEGPIADVVLGYLRTGEGEGFNDLTEASVSFEAWLIERFKSQLGIFVTHDWFCAALLAYHRINIDWCKANWIHFCDGIVIVIEKRGDMSYALVRSHQA